MITAFVMVQANPDSIPEVAERMVALDGVREVYSVTGDTDLIAVVRVKDHDDLADVIADRLSKIEGVRSTRTYLGFRAYSKEDLDAAFDIGN